MATKLEIKDAKNRIDELLDRARSGEEFVLAEQGNPVVRITPAAAPGGTRVFGEFQGKVWMSDDFTAPLSGEDLAEWER